jgi:hypothetical protein
MPSTEVVKRLSNGGLIFWCPGCDSSHAINSHPDGPRWVFNGDYVKPTFAPSILVTFRWHDADGEMENDICHSFVTKGRIEFLSDSTHFLKGQTVDLLPWPHPNWHGVET